MILGGKRYVVHGSRSDEFTIWNLADLHWGARACAEDKIKRDIKRIADDPYSFFIGGGDYIDGIGRNDKRFRTGGLAPWIKVEDLGNLGWLMVADIRKLFEPIKHKCLGLIYGNHELAIQHQQDQDLHGWLCTDLGVPNLGYTCLFDLVFVRKPRTTVPILRTTTPGQHSTETFRVCAYHGCGAARTLASKLKRLQDVMSYFEADLYFAAHVHHGQQALREITVGGDADCKAARQIQRLGVISGSYLKTYADGETTYGEMRGYAPSVLGAAAIRIRPETREVTAEV